MEVVDQEAGHRPGSRDGPERNGESGDDVLERRDCRLVAEQPYAQPACGRRQAVGGER